MQGLLSTDVVLELSKLGPTGSSLSLWLLPYLPFFTRQDIGRCLFHWTLQQSPLQHLHSRSSAPVLGGIVAVGYFKAGPPGALWLRLHSIHHTALFVCFKSEALAASVIPPHPPHQPWSGALDDMPPNFGRSTLHNDQHPNSMCQHWASIMIPSPA